MITSLAPAKINLFLHVTGKRADGYHFLESLVVFADYGDDISVEQADGLRLEISGPFARDIDAGPDNLVLKAARLLQQECGARPGARIHLIKRLPVASGIGGGSSDAATTLKLLNRLWRLDITDERLAKLGLSLGADVPVCLLEKPALMRGIGEELQEVVRHGIHFESIPGITAASAAASRTGIPLTHRDHAQSVKFVTACKKNGAPNNDYSELMDSSQTVVFYMGLHRLHEMTQGLIAGGRDSETPFAIISHASMPTQQVLIGTLSDIADQQAEAKLPTPALLIMGDVVTLYHEFADYNLGAMGKGEFVDVDKVISSNDLIPNLESIA